MTKPYELLSRKQVLAALGVTHNTLVKHVRDGSFPAPALIMGRPRWKKEDVDNYVKQRFDLARDKRLVGA